MVAAQDDGLFRATALLPVPFALLLAPIHLFISLWSDVFRGKRRTLHSCRCSAEGEERGRVGRASGEEGEGGWNSRRQGCASGGIPARGPGVSPNLCPPAQYRLARRGSHKQIVDRRSGLREAA